MGDPGSGRRWFFAAATVGAHILSRVASTWGRFRRMLAWPAAAVLTRVGTAEERAVPG
jgi:hypothetical protein